jgi:general secretion pathway protein K
VKRNSSSRPALRDDGVALIVVVWVVMVLSLLIAGFAFTMQVETQIASYHRKSVQALAVAHSGVEVAKMFLVQDAVSPTTSGADFLDEAWSHNEEFYQNHVVGSGFYNVTVTDEESKLNINQLTQLQLRRLLNLLDVEWGNVDVVVDSILDWIDDNDLTRLEGAESDYYMSLVPPYRAKNAPIDQLDELLLVRGVTPEILYGTPATEDEEARPGLIDFVTTMPTRHVNINTASPVVLQVALDIDSQTAENIVTRRNGAGGDTPMPFRSIEELNTFLNRPQTARATDEQIPLGTTSTIFTVKSVANVGGVQRIVFATLRRDGPNVTLVSWRERAGAQ